WDAGDGGVSDADLTGNGITVSNVPVPAISSATYDASTGSLVVAGTGFQSMSGATNDIVASKLTFTGEGGATYTLTDTSNVDITSATSFTIDPSATDEAGIAAIVNKNGTSSSGGAAYNLAAAQGWDAGDGGVSDADLTGNGITVSNVPVPAITSSTYDASSGALVVTGTEFLSLNGATNDIVASKLTFTGDGGATYTLTDTANVDITSATTFTIELSATDKAGLAAIVNKNGASSTGGTTYNLAAAQGWDAGDGGAADADLTGNGITVSNVPVPAIISATYDAASGTLVVTGTDLLSLNGSNNDIVAAKLTLTGDGGATYTLTNTANVDVSSGTSFTLTLSATDRAGVDLILNKDGTSSIGGTTYNLAAAQGWDAGADASVLISDTTGNGVAARNVNTAPTLLHNSPTFGTIPDFETAAPSGTVGVLVSQVINTTGISNFSDPDAGTQTGLAITAMDTSHGVWWYSTDGGSHWAVAPAVSNTSALLLSADGNSRLYFQLTATGFSGTLSSAMTFRAWDETSGVAGTQADTSVNGGSTAFSSATDAASLNVNTSPVVSNLNGDSVTFTEKGPATLIDAGGNAIVADSDSPDFGGGSLTASIVGNRVSGEDVLSIVNQGSGSGQIGVSGSNVLYGGTVIGTFTGGTGTNDLVVAFNGSATPAAAQALVRDIAYSDSNATDPAVAPRTIGLTVNDGAGGTSTPADITVNVIGVNDPPTLVATGGPPTFIENGPAVSLFTGASISTIESGQGVKSITLTVSNVADGSNEILNIDGSALALTNGNSVTTAIDGMDASVRVAGGTATVTISRAAGITTTAAQTLVDGMTYQDTSSNPSTADRVVTLTSIQDSGGTSNGGVDTSNVS